ncbi:hypothetical protein ACFE04_000084 [Oxalis oulophora]
MTSVCISNCVNDASDPRIPVRATYVNLYKWPESDAEFVKSVAANMRRGMHHINATSNHPRVVDSISCRQMFLRSYTFSREEDHKLVPEKTNKCFGKVAKQNKVTSNNGRKRRIKESNKKGGGGGGGTVSDGGQKRRCLVIRKMSNALFKMFHGCLACATSVDVVDRND